MGTSVTYREAMNVSEYSPMSNNSIGPLLERKEELLGFWADLLLWSSCLYVWIV